MSRIKTYMGGQIVTDEDLQHWKYLRKYMKDGKWRYVYKKRNKFEETNHGFVKSGNDPLYYQREYEKDSDNLFTTSTTLSIQGKNYVEKYKYTEVGKIDQAMSAGKEWIDDKLSSLFSKKK